MASTLGLVDPSSPPVSIDQDRWRLVQSYVASYGIIRHHLDSFNYMIDYTIPLIVRNNAVVTCKTNPHFHLIFEGVDVKVPSAPSDAFLLETNRAITPHECRLRNLTYAAPIYARLRYKVSKDEKYNRVLAQIGRIPIMLRSNRCILCNKTKLQQAFSQECFADPGGYFIINGVEKSVLLCEQMAMNKILVGRNSDGLSEATVASSTAERKSRTSVVLKNRKFYLTHNTFGTSMINICAAFRAMGFTSDVEILSLIGTDPLFLDYMNFTVQECASLDIYSQEQALEYLSSKFGPRHYIAKRTPVQEARDCLASVILCHIPVVQQVPVTAPPGMQGTTAQETQQLTTTICTGMFHNWRPKAVYLATMIRRVILFDCGILKEDDRDFIGNKKLESTGDILSLLFEDLFKHLLVSISHKADSLSKKTNRTDVSLEVNNLVDQSIITRGMNSSLSTGHFKMERFRLDRIGVSQVVSRLSYMAALGQMTRIASSFEKSRKSSGPRQLNFSQMGIFCPADTPEGESVGLVKNLSLLCHISVDCDQGSSSGGSAVQQAAAPLHSGLNNLRIREEASTPKTPQPVGFNNTFKRLLYSLGIVDLSICYAGDAFVMSYAAFFNGEILGSIPVAHVHNFTTTLRRMRRRGFIDSFTSVYTNEHQRSVYINTDGGRACRPLLVVNSGRTLLQMTDIQEMVGGTKSFADLVLEGKVEYIDVNESKNIFIAGHPRDLTSASLNGESYTHCEIEAYALLGYVIGLIPYPHHNQSPRNCYNCSMGKQSISAIAYNQFERFENCLFILNYPQKPLTTTKILELTNFESLPGGQNATVCIMSYGGFDIEDAVILNRSSVDRGYGRIEVYRTTAEELKSHDNNLIDRLSGPPSDLYIAKEVVVKKGGENDEGAVTTERVLNQARAKFLNIDVDGLGAVGQRYDSGDFIIHKQIPENTRVQAGKTGPQDTTISYRQQPVSLKSPLDTSTYIDKILLTTNRDGNLQIKVLTREPRRPEVGDKYSSRHGQKGVIGLIVPQRDMPFSPLGITPDMIMNPHGFPSRMTVGKLLEVVANKVGALEGMQIDATPFGTNSYKAAQMSSIEHKGVEDCSHSSGSSGPAGLAESDIRAMSDDAYIDILSEKLITNGYNYIGKDVLYSGITGEPIPTYIFNGPIYYQRLKHMVRDKMHSRATGPRAMLTRQPTEGRKAQGGLRLGSMETDALISYGASSLLIERLMVCSDEFLADVCSRCGMLCYDTGSSHRNASSKWCQTCQTGAEIVKIRLPYATKLMLQELYSMGVVVRMSLDNAV